MSETSLSPKRPRLEYDENSGKPEHFEKYKSRDRERDQDDQSSYSHSHSKHRKRQEPAEEEDNKEDDGKTKLGAGETARREHTLVMRLTNKEQELQDCMNQIQEMKQAQTQNTAQLRSMLLDPAINLVFQRMAKEMDDHKDKLKQKQNELTAWKFTPDSQTGMRVMARCRMLLSENQELGKMISSGRTAKLEGEIVLHKALVTEMKKNQKELDEFVGELEEDVEGMQGMIFMLRQQLKEAQEQIARLQAENEQLRTLRIPPDPEPGGSSLTKDELDLSSLSSVDKPCSQQTADSGPVSESSHQDHLASAPQSTHGNLLSTSELASDVTPDSGVHTQEEDEETSMDTTESATQQPKPTCDQRDSIQLLADSTADSNGSSGQQAVVANCLPEVTSQALPEVQSESSKLESNGEDGCVRTTPQVTNNRSDDSNIHISTTCSNHSPSSTNTSESPTLARTSDAADNKTATGGKLGPAAAVDEANSPCPSSARTTQNLPPKSRDEAGENGRTDFLSSEDHNGDRITQDEDKTQIHQGLGLAANINPKVEDDKIQCQTALGLVNGSTNAHN